MSRKSGRLKPITPHTKKFTAASVLESRGFNNSSRKSYVNKKYKYAPATFNPFAALARRKK